MQLAWTKLTRVCSLRHRSAVRLLLAANTQPFIGTNTTINEQSFNPNLLRSSDDKVRNRTNSVQGDNYANKPRNRKCPPSTRTDAAIFSCGEGIEIINNDVNK